jgi:PAS domain S-box-containing protein
MSIPDQFKAPNHREARLLDASRADPRWDRFAWLPIPALLLTMIILREERPDVSFESNFLETALNFIFSTLASLYIAYLIARSFMARGSPGLLLLGCAVSALGISGVVGNAVSGGNPDQDVAISNLIWALSALLHLSGAILLLNENVKLRARGECLSAAYVGLAGAIGLIALASVNGLLPAFFVPGQGGTPLREIVLGSTIAMLLLTVYLTSLRWRSSQFAYWYGLGLLSVSAAFLAFLMQSSIWSPLKWTGIAALCLGGVYLVLAALASVRESEVWGMPLEEALRETQVRLAGILGSITDAFLAVSKDWRIEFVNDHFARRVGIAREEIIGKNLWELFPASVGDDARNQLRAAMAGRKGVEYEVFYEPIKSWFLDKAYPTDDGGLAVYSREITSRKRAEEKMTILIDELNHRVKNTLAIVQSIAIQTFKSGQADSVERFQARLTALSSAHDVLTRKNWEGADLTDIVSDAVAAYRNEDRDRFRIAGPQVQMSPKATLDIAMALHELCTNATKYGALSRAGGHVAINWRVNSDAGAIRVRIDWRENGGPPVVAPARKGFGVRLIEKVLAEDLDAEVELAYPSEGVTCSIDVALAHPGPEQNR